MRVGVLDDVAVVVVTYDSSRDVARLLGDINADPRRPAEVVVVDNDSSDDSVDVATAHGAAVVELGDNRGFSAAVNAGFAATTSEIVILLNPDCRVEPGNLESISKAVGATAEAGVVGPLVVNPDGSVQRSCRRFPSIIESVVHGFVGLFWPRNPLSVSYTMADWDHDSRRTVDWVSASAVGIRRAAFDDIGGFDPGYFMYVEDVDFCWRLWQAGWAVVFDPSGKVEHAIGTSSSGARYRLIIEHHKSMLRFEAKRRSKSSPVWMIIWVGVWMRAFVAVAHAWFSRGRTRNGTAIPAPHGKSQEPAHFAIDSAHEELR